MVKGRCKHEDRHGEEDRSSNGIRPCISERCLGGTQNHCLALRKVRANDADLNSAILIGLKLVPGGLVVPWDGL